MVSHLERITRASRPLDALDLLANQPFGNINGGVAHRLFTQAGDNALHDVFERIVRETGSTGRAECGWGNRARLFNREKGGKCFSKRRRGRR